LVPGTVGRARSSLGPVVTIVYPISGTVANCQPSVPPQNPGLVTVVDGDLEVDYSARHAGLLHCGRG
jgi:hypothetical protein